MTKEAEGERSFQPVFLYEENLQQIESDRLCRMGDVGFTRLKAFISHDYFHKSLGKHLIDASAALYVADVVRCDASYGEREPHEEIVLSGGIIIYRESSAGSALGLDLLKTGKIWFGRRPEEIQLGGHVLFNAMFPVSSDQQTVRDRIEQIVRGYGVQEKKRAHREARLMLGSR